MNSKLKCFKQIYVLLLCEDYISCHGMGKILVWLPQGVGGGGGWGGNSYFYKIPIIKYRICEKWVPEV